jgi:hypothetical protein
VAGATELEVTSWKDVQYLLGECRRSVSPVRPFVGPDLALFSARTAQFVPPTAAINT